MKQHITKEQWDELSEAQKQRIYDFSKLNEWHLLGVHPDGVKTFLTFMLPNIGQMIEFLCDNIDDSMTFMGDEKYQQNYIYDDFSLGYNGELCDSLWEAVKKVLNTTSP